MRIAKSKAYEEYAENHKCCPKCNSDYIESQTRGFLFIDGIDYEDKNKAFCKCGWSGIVHDLVRKEK